METLRQTRKHIQRKTSKRRKKVHGKTKTNKEKENKNALRKGCKKVMERPIKTKKEKWI